MIEVEIKAKISDANEIRKIITKLGAAFKSKEIESDVYYNAPHKDFAETDEALRIRTSSDISMTYKGPKIDSVSKSREEIYIILNDAKNADLMLKALGFKETATVRKMREIYTIDEITISIDAVDGIGEFIEIEILSDDYQNSLDKVFGMLELLGLKRENTIRESYLELVLFKKS
ncbi:MAG: class IV adenylate cyclase [Methanosarcinaceae archaeon]|jgi:adenylate cyclase class 2|nr:class IV adenylate cyclase [Methanosarcinaceae archaeon]